MCDRSHLARMSEISIHEIRVCQALRSDTGRWFTSKDIAMAADVALRTANAHSRRLAQLGIVDRAEVFPGNRYRWSALAETRNGSYCDKIKSAAQVLGVEWK